MIETRGQLEAKALEIRDGISDQFHKISSLMDELPKLPEGRLSAEWETLHKAMSRTYEAMEHLQSLYHPTTTPSVFTTAEDVTEMPWKDADR